MKTQLLVNDIVIPLNEFTQLYIGNILRGIASSLGCTGTNLVLNMDTDELNLYSGETDVRIKKPFARSLVESTLKGMLSPLRAVVWIDRVTIMTDE